MHRYKQTPAIVLLVIGIALMMMPSVPRALVLAVLAAAAVLMESNRTVPETIEHVEVTGGTFLLQVCVVY